LDVSPLTILRWELPEDSKEARRPRAKMIEALRRLSAEGIGREAADVGDEADEDDDASEPTGVTASSMPSIGEAPSADEVLLAPLLERLNGVGWQHAEDELLRLLSASTLTGLGRHLATMGLVQVQVLARLDTRGALAALLPILDEASRGALPAPLAGRAHALAAMIFSQPDSRLFDPGRINAHAARAEELLGAHADDLHVLVVVSRLAATRFLGSDVTLHVYQTYGHHLQRAGSSLATMLADGVHAVVATDRNDVATATRHGARCWAAAQQLNLWGTQLAMLADHAARALRAAQAPDVILEITRRGKECGRAGDLPPTEPLIRLLATECEALCRLARFEDAQRTASEALQTARRGGVARFALTGPLGRLYVFTDRLDELKALAESFEQEATGQRAVAGLHAAYVRALLASLSGDLPTATELCERVCSAPDATPGIDYLLHDAHFELTACYLLAGNAPRAREMLRRDEALIAKRPSVWHSAMFRRAESIQLMQQGLYFEARQKIEATKATFNLLGDVLQAALEDAGLAMAAKASGAPEGDELLGAALARIGKLGVSTEFLKRRAQLILPPAQSAWREQTLPEKLVSATERLGVPGLDAQALLRELSVVLQGLFSGRETRVGGSELLQEWGEVVDVPSSNPALRLGVKGPLSPEERAVLRLLATFLARNAPRAHLVEPEPPVDSLLPEFIAASPITRQLKQEISRLSRSSATILITGESGSGKEVVARAVHDLSVRAAMPYVAFNCASVPRDLFESQLFGYRKGAFTGAAADSPGVIRAADGGTLFLDEIGELPLETQPKLLRFLENAEVFPLGEQKPRRVNVRVLAATHRDLGLLVREGRFREDLYYRLNVVPLHVHPLRERREDVTALARMFLARLTSEGEKAPALGADAIRALESHSWPGNVRELRNVMERAMAYSPIPSVLSASQLRISN
jgi:predicted ATP-dependent protease